MKAICYLRVARSPRGFVFGVTGKPSASPLTTGSYNDPLVTRQFKLVLNLPDNAFRGLDGEIAIDVPEHVLTEVVRAQAEESA
ncbi:MAG TPA: hypothetical protein VFH80_17530 [Solirubrobacteraceae bacterium]|nr:hypothetical protein [Solirubrobacteraceae bacterium]